MKLESRRTGKVVDCVNVNNGVYTIQLEDGSFKELAESTVKRWYRAVKEEAVVETSQDTVKQKINSVVCPQPLETNLVEKATKARKPKTPSNAEFKNKVGHLLTEFAHKLELKIEKRKEYTGVYTQNKKKVAEIRSSRTGVKIAVRPMVFLMLDEQKRKQCFYLNERCNMHFRTTMEINSISQLDLAEELIKLSLSDLEG